jgi:hypothetical protein
MWAEGAVEPPKTQADIFFSAQVLSITAKPVFQLLLGIWS